MLEELEHLWGVNQKDGDDLMPRVVLSSRSSTHPQPLKLVWQGLHGLAEIARSTSLTNSTRLHVWPSGIP